MRYFSPPKKKSIDRAYPNTYAVLDPALSGGLVELHVFFDGLRLSLRHCLISSHSDVTRKSLETRLCIAYTVFFVFMLILSGLPPDSFTCLRLSKYVWQLREDCETRRIKVHPCVMTDDETPQSCCKLLTHNRNRGPAPDSCSNCPPCQPQKWAEAASAI